MSDLIDYNDVLNKKSQVLSEKEVSRKVPILKTYVFTFEEVWNKH